MFNDFMASVSQAIKGSGGPAVVAARLGVSTQRLCNWLARGVPVSQAAAFEAAVDHRIRRIDLFPGEWALIWPELAQQYPEEAAECLARRARKESADAHP
jgi:DNA-binding transcriptional regulator YdaS (Cro superfamily)